MSTQLYNTDTFSSMLAGGHLRYKTLDGMEDTWMANKRVYVASK